MIEATKTLAMGWLDPSDPEWELVWQWVEERHGDTECRCPITNEVWQYMGSSKVETAEGKVMWVHQLRHRALPAKSGLAKDLRHPGARTLAQVEATPTWKPDLERAWGS